MASCEACSEDLAGPGSSLGLSFSIYKQGVWVN